MSEGDRLSHLLQVAGIVQMAYTSTIRAAKAWYGHEPLSDSFSDAALQIQCSFSDGYIQEAGTGQEIVDVPPSCFFNAFRYQDMAIHALEAAWTSRRAGVGIVPPDKVHDTQGSDRYLPGLRQ